MTMCTCKAQLLPHDPLPNVCPEKFYGMPMEEWKRHGALPPHCDDPAACWTCTPPTADEVGQ